MTQNSAGADLSLKQNMALGLQHFLAVFVSNMTPMLIVTNLIHLPEGERMALVQATMVIAGLATIFQLKRVGIFGSELPMFIGSNANFLPILMAIAVSYGMEGILGATIVGGLVAILFGIFIKPLSRFIPNVVAGTVVLSVGLSLIPISVDYWAGGTGAADYGSLSNLFLGFIVLTVILVLQEFAGGFIKKAAVLFGIFVGYVAAIIMNKVDFMPLMQASMVSLPEFMPFRPAFHLDAIIAVAIIYIAVCVKMVGDMNSITLGALNREPTLRELRGNITTSGLFSIIGGMFGTFPHASFSQNVGLVVSTKVVNRASMFFCGLVMLLAGIFPKISVLFSSMPPAILGGALLIVFSSIIVTGIQMLFRENLNGRNGTIVALSLGLGFAVISVPEALVQLPEMVQLIFGKSMVNTTFATAFILNLLLPKSKEGKAKWGQE